MRALAILLLLASLGAAEGLSESEVAEIKHLVATLGSPHPRARRWAFEQLQRRGAEILPVLDEMRPTDPEIRRRLHVLLRASRRLKLYVPEPPAAHRLGADLQFEVVLRNETEDGYVIPFAYTSEKRAGTFSTFLVDIGDGDTFLLRPDQVELLTATDAYQVLRPGQALRLRVTLGGERSPLRAPGKIEIVARFRSSQVTKRYGPPGRPTEMHQDTLTVDLAAKPFTITAAGRTAAQLGGLLRSGNPAKRDAALAELRVRDDPALLPLLRELRDDPDVRLHTVRRLGRAGLARDLGLLKDATKDPRQEVRLAAVEALGHYAHPGARRRLILLTQDAELREAAVGALARRKHARTIDCFVALLKGQYRGPWADVARKSITEWTGLPLEDRLSEIQAFERWWLSHRAAWIREQARK